MYTHVRLYVRSYARFNPLPFPGAFSLEIKKVGNHKTLFLAPPPRPTERRPSSLPGRGPAPLALRVLARCSTTTIDIDCIIDHARYRSITPHTDICDMIYMSVHTAPPVSTLSCTPGRASVQISKLFGPGLTAEVCPCLRLLHMRKGSSHARPAFFNWPLGRPAAYCPMSRR